MASGPIIYNLHALLLFEEEADSHTGLRGGKGNTMSMS